MPLLRKIEGSKQLIVDGEPFLILGGELQNSSFSSAKYMKDIWPKLKAANLNTVFAAVAWEQIEPAEGHFDFNELDQLIVDARSHQLRLVLLWFGSFKNGTNSFNISVQRTEELIMARQECPLTYHRGLN